MADDGAGAAQLTALLVGLERAGLPAAAARRLQWVAARAFAEVMAGLGRVCDGSRLPVADPGLCTALEEALHAVSLGLGGGAKLNVSQAKLLLRQHGAAGLASRLGRLSKARNTHAHPDVGLLEAIHQLGVGGPDDGSCSSRCSRKSEGGEVMLFDLFEADRKSVV